jgi:catechol 2,3-dioxygenase-like lactoylglutathione lyase family enzyme
MAKQIVRQVSHLCIFTRDLDASQRFWNGVLGMPITFRFSRNGKPFGFYFTAGGMTNIEIFENMNARYDNTNAVNHLALEVFDIDDAMATARAAGVEVTDKKLGVDDTWQAWLEDPNGVKIEFFMYTHKSAQIVGGDRVADW